VPRRRRVAQQVLLQHHTTCRRGASETRLGLLSGLCSSRIAVERQQPPHSSRQVPRFGARAYIFSGRPPTDSHLARAAPAGPSRVKRNTRSRAVPPCAWTATPVVSTKAPLHPSDGNALVQLRPEIRFHRFVFSSGQREVGWQEFEYPGGFSCAAPRDPGGRNARWSKRIDTREGKRFAAKAAGASVPARLFDQSPLRTSNSYGRAHAPRPHGAPSVPIKPDLSLRLSGALLSGSLALHSSPAPSSGKCHVRCLRAAFPPGPPTEKAIPGLEVSPGAREALSPRESMRDPIEGDIFAVSPAWLWPAAIAERIELLDVAYVRNPRLLFHPGAQAILEGAV